MLSCVKVLDYVGMARALFCSVLIGVALLASGCSTPGDSGAATQADIEAVAAAATAEPKFQGGEKIRISVYNEPTLSGDYAIDPSGVVSLPLVGTVQAVGLTKGQLEEALTIKFKSQYLRNPQVTVTVLGYRPIYFVGEIAKPGEYPYKPGLNILTAMAMAGGGTYRANKNYVLIQHNGETGSKEYPQTASTMILPGDLIRVPERYF
jgi:protein involved in polysaccharide export with SLBB domain